MPQHHLSLNQEDDIGDFLFLCTLAGDLGNVRTWTQLNLIRNFWICRTSSYGLPTMELNTAGWLTEFMS